MKKKILITGGAGFLGSYWAKEIQDQFDLTVTFSKKKLENKQIKSINIDLTSEEQVKSIFETYSPDIIIHTVGLTDVDSCEKDPELAYKTNVITTKNICNYSPKECKIIYISTDHLYDGLSSFYKEEDQLAPLNVYAKTKLEGEKLCQQSRPNSLIIRTNFYGNSLAEKKSYTDWLLQELRTKDRVYIHDDNFFTPIYIEELIKFVHLLIDKNANGIFNVVGSERISKFEFAKQLAISCKLDYKKLLPTTNLKQPKKVKRPLDMSLSNQKLINYLKQQPENLKDSFFRMNPLKGESSMIPYGKHFIDEDDINAVVDVLRNGFLTQGPKVFEFEKKICDLTGAKYAVAVANWTVGIHISCLAAGLNSSNTLITSPMSFCASSNGALYCNSTPHFADIDPESLNINPAKIEELCKKLGNVKAIMPVHFGGLACDMEAISAIAKKYNAVVIEDAAHAIGGKYSDGSLIGNCKYSDMVGFSFHPVKNIACGEGGVITTNNEDLYRKLLRLRSHGINKMDDPLIQAEAFTDGKPNQWYYEMQELGYNYRITDIQCALGISQLNKLTQFLNRRIDIANLYDKEFSNLTFAKIPQKGLRNQSGNHLYLLRVDYQRLGKSRYQVIEELKHNGIQGHVHYLPIPMLPYYQNNYPTPLENYKEALSYYREALTLPLYPTMKDEDVKKVIDSVKRIIG
jgi:perosamine synthetase